MGDLRNVFILDFEKYEEIKIRELELKRVIEEKDEALKKLYALVRNEVLDTTSRRDKIPYYISIETSEICKLVGYCPADDPDVQSAISEYVEEE